MKARHKKYEFVMTRTYETTIGIMADNEREATEIYNKLGDSIYDIDKYNLLVIRTRTQEG